ncbi:MAG: hypothetical protein ACM3MK_02370 [Chitinophagales bacterium]
MENEQLIALVDDFFRDKNVGRRRWNYISFCIRGYIPERKLVNARKLYAPFDTEQEMPLILMDDTLSFLSGKIGFLMTNCTLYYRLKRLDGNCFRLISGKIPLDDIETIHIQLRKKGSPFIVNGEAIGKITAYSDGRDGLDDEGRTLIELLHRIVDSLHNKGS